MRRLTEDAVKRYLHERGHPVPRGWPVDSPDAADRQGAQGIEGGAVVKALVPAGRRGKAGGVRIVEHRQALRAAVAALLGSGLGEFVVRRVLIEERVTIARELYLSFALRGPRPEVILSSRGGIEIEELFEHRPDQVVRAEIDPLRGLPPWEATALWLRAGLTGRALPALADLTAALYQSFCTADALLLELNPLALLADGSVCLVGAMMGIDDCALYRHPAWRAIEDAEDLPANPRERAVAVANQCSPGGECGYLELAGDIGLLVGGGGAGLYQHDLLLEFGGHPANHCVTPPTGSDDRKLKAVIRAILAHPRLNALLVGFNFAQMARADVRVRALVEVLDEIAPRHAALPIVIRLFGAGEDDARALVRHRENICYVPRGTSLRDAVALVVRRAAAAVAITP